MTRLTLEEFTKRIVIWAVSSKIVTKVLIAGSQSKKDSLDYLATESDVDLIVFLSIADSYDSVLRSLAKLGLNLGILIHPLIIQIEDLALKTAIPEYREIIQSAKTLFDIDDYKKNKNLNN